MDVVVRANGDGVSHNRHRHVVSFIARLGSMPFRALIVGSPSFCDYAKLRSILDMALSKRLPDVVLVTTGGSGLPAPVASYARSRNLPVEVAPIERYPLDVRKSPLVGLVGKVEAEAGADGEDNASDHSFTLSINPASLPPFTVFTRLSTGQHSIRSGRYDWSVGRSSSGV
jgi:hypothetical protein